jgi:hypothetical protein
MGKSNHYTEDDQPIPFDENDEPQFWSYKDPGDSALPSSGGLIRDMVYFLRGTEAPTLFTIWSTLWAVSTALKREAWVKWFTGELFTNYYTLLIGPAGLVKKSFSVDVACKALRGMRRFISDTQLREMKHIALVTGKATPEALLEAMIPKKKRGPEFHIRGSDGAPLYDEKGRPIMYRKTSEVGIALSELASTIGRKDYSKGFIEDLLDLYDPKERWLWRTVKRGAVVLRKTHTTLIAASTPSGFRQSVPTVATSDGFLSRSVICYQSWTEREFAEPIASEKGPTEEDLQRRLGWISGNIIGEFTLSPEAKDFFSNWYHAMRQRLKIDVAMQGVHSRLDVMLRKVALLIRAQRYDPVDDNREISLQDVKDAENLLRKTLSESTTLIRSLVSASDPEGAGKIEEALRKHGGRLSRTVLMRNSHVNAQDLNGIIDQLFQEGRVKIMLKGKPQEYPSRNGEETYEWVGDTWAEEPSADEVG